MRACAQAFEKKFEAQHQRRRNLVQVVFQKLQMTNAILESLARELTGVLEKSKGHDQVMKKYKGYPETPTEFVAQCIGNVSCCVPLGPWSRSSHNVLGFCATVVVHCLTCVHACVVLLASWSGWSRSGANAAASRAGGDRGGGGAPSSVRCLCFVGEGFSLAKNDDQANNTTCPSSSVC